MSGDVQVTGFCPRCGQAVPTFHTKPTCDAMYDAAYDQTTRDLIAAAEQRGRETALRDAAQEWATCESEDDATIAFSEPSRRWLPALDWLRERADREAP